MKILVVEDDQNKREHLVSFLSQEITKSTISTASSFRSAMVQIMSYKWDLLILDMTLPQFDVTETEHGYRTNSFAGLDIIREMKRRNVQVPTIVVSQYGAIGEGSEKITLSELDKQLSRDYPKVYRGAVFYATGQSKWMVELKAALESHD